MRRNLLNLFIVLGVLIVITACVCKSDRDDESNSSGPSSTPAISTSNTTAKNTSSNQVEKKKDQGDFTVEHIDVVNPKFAEIDKQVRQERLLEKGADALNRALILPTNIMLRTKDCNGEVNAFYNPDDDSITVCYELMEHFFKVFKSAGSSDDVAYQKMFDAVRFVFLHEVGHALIDQYKLPIMGNEEDAADRCSAFINLTELGDSGVKAVFAAADAFAIESKMTQGKDRNMSDEHLLSEQRFYNSLCMIYGSDTSKYENIVTQGYLPKERAVRCETEYQKTVDSWVSLLAPWRKK
ncbi:MAG: DUF4344 domain-containing metallopeptidase [Candidatus Binatia bacterium]